MLAIPLLAFAVLGIATSTNAEVVERDGCQSGYSVCSPPGATTTSTPKIGDVEFTSLFVDLVKSNLPPSTKRSLSHLNNPESSDSLPRDSDTNLSPRDGASLCCVTTLTCLTLSTLALPFCYDPFTTNYFLPDGSYGTVVGGAYVSSGVTANLETGAYTYDNGTSGNFYTVDPANKPNVATLVLPTQYTGTGVGTAIPASALGAEVTLTLTTIIPGSTIQPSIIPGTTIADSTQIATATSQTTVLELSNGVTFSTTVTVGAVLETVLPAVTVGPSTVLGTTVVESTKIFVTTVPAVVASSLTGSGTSTSSVSTTTSSAGAGERRAETAAAWGAFGLLGILRLL